MESNIYQVKTNLLIFIAFKFVEIFE